MVAKSRTKYAAKHLHAVATFWGKTIWESRKDNVILRQSVQLEHNEIAHSFKQLKGVAIPKFA